MSVAWVLIPRNLQYVVLQYVIVQSQKEEKLQTLGNNIYYPTNGLINNKLSKNDKTRISF